MSSGSSIAILGGGISGLSIGWALKKHGVDTTIYEQQHQAGGVIQTDRGNGWLVEQGPNTMLVRDQQIWDLLDDLHLTEQIAKPGPEAKKRYIVRDKKLCAAPLGILDFLKSDLFSASAKFRLLKEPFISKSHKTDESIAQFIERRLGSELLDYAVNPFVSGVYAGDPKRLSVKHTFSSLFELEQSHGSLARGVWKREKKTNRTENALISFRGGLHQLPGAMSQKLGDDVQLATVVNQLSKTATDWKITLRQHGENIEKHHDAIISALPAHQLPEIWVDPKSKRSISQLADIKYVPLSVLALGFKREQIDHPLDGFGMLIPEKEPSSLLGCLFSSSLFEGRAPKNHVLLTCFIGGARQPELAKASTETLIAKALPQLRDLLGITGQPVYNYHTFWKKAIPQYNVGYDTYLQSMHQIEKANPGFFPAGNFRGGVSVPDCILNGFKMAEKVDNYL